MTAHVNSKLYSHGDRPYIYWPFSEMVAYASRGTRLFPGDIIGSGTVGTGCILELSNLHGEAKYPWLVPGDEVRVSVEMLGDTISRVVPGCDVIPIRDA